MERVEPKPPRTGRSDCLTVVEALLLLRHGKWRRHALLEMLLVRCALAPRLGPVQEARHLQGRIVHLRLPVLSGSGKSML